MAESDLLEEVADSWAAFVMGGLFVLRAGGGA
jgi:hypothetical protein